MQVRGLEYEEIQAATGDYEKILDVNPLDLFDRAAAFRRERGSPAFSAVAEAYKRANNIVDSEWAGLVTSNRWGKHADKLREPAELRLRDATTLLKTQLAQALQARQPAKALAAIAAIQPQLASFFDQVRVVVDDEDLKEARLSLLAEIRDHIRDVGDISVLAPKP